MFTTKLRKVGGSAMLAVPPSFLESLELAVDSEVSLEVDGNSLVIRGVAIDLTLAELLAKCDLTAPPPDATGWEDRAPTGGEIL